MKKFKFKVSEISDGNKVSEFKYFKGIDRFDAENRLREMFPDSKYTSSFIEEIYEVN